MGRATFSSNPTVGILEETKLTAETRAELLSTPSLSAFPTGPLNERLSRSGRPTHSAPAAINGRSSSSAALKSNLRNRKHVPTGWYDPESNPNPCFSLKCGEGYTHHCTTRHVSSQRKIFPSLRPRLPCISHPSEQSSRECVQREVRWLQSFRRRIVFDPPSVWREYSDVFEKVGLEADVRVIVLASGLEKCFTAGLDWKCALRLVPRLTSLTVSILQ